MVGITETVLRDGHQSLIATRMRTEHMLPAAERLDAIGYRSLEVVGRGDVRRLPPVPPRRPVGAAPHAEARGCRRRRSRCSSAARTWSATGTTPDDVVEKFVAEAARQGVDMFRVFDALNDPAEHGGRARRP